MIRVIPLRVIATLVALSVSLSSSAQPPDDGLNQQLDQATGQSQQQQDTVNDQLDQAEGQATQQQGELNEQLDQAAEQSDIQRGEPVEEIERNPAPEDPSSVLTPLQERELRLGVSIDEEAAVSDGMLVGEIMAGSAAATAGLRRGDLIVSVDGQTVATVDELDRLIAGYSVGDSVDIIVLRDGENFPLAVTFDDTHFLPAADYPPLDATIVDDIPRDYLPPATHTLPPATHTILTDVADFGPEAPRVGPHGWLGVRLQPSNPPHRQHGVGIVSVVPDGPADLAGIVAGDRILSIDNETLSSPAHLLDLLERTNPGDRVDLLVLGHGTQRLVTVELAEARFHESETPVIHWHYTDFAPWHAHYAYWPGHWHYAGYAPWHWHYAHYHYSPWYAHYGGYAPYWRYAGYSNGHWQGYAYTTHGAHTHAEDTTNEPVSDRHDDLMAQHERLVEQQARIERMLHDIEADLSSIQHQLDRQPTSGTIEEIEFGNNPYR